METNQKEEGLSSTEEGSMEVENKKCCSYCKTTKTPLWRSGPSGPKSLCNACGIRYRKKSPSPPSPEEKKGKNGKSKSVNKLREELKVNLMKMPLEKRLSHFVKKKKQRSPRQWGEVERAALLLMALSCGAIFA
ncbi:hypothetical protein ACJIZ3_015915 [Penstemon smallii]|uniref:GATA-type domain-containing protein n=1 Tax=Penstemon smallii TaxID=265156 RepID=A0ABD3RNV3_9LAMI